MRKVKGKIYEIILILNPYTSNIFLIFFGKWIAQDPGTIVGNREWGKRRSRNSEIMGLIGYPHLVGSNFFGEHLNCIDV